MRPLLRSVGLLALALASGSAHALGLGQIQVKSGLGEPLVAEIPVISADPSELVDLDAGLASPETFTRIGLEPPVGIVADLRFTIGSDAQGRPVIRVTTAQPVTQPLLDFLIQVDWGQGRLVREYSATVGSPGSVAAQPSAPVQAPEVEAPAVIERPVAAAPTPAAEPVPRATQSPRPTPAPRATQSPRAGAAPAAPAAAAATADEYRVRAGDTASRIATRIAPPGVTTEQTVVGLLRANPAAFIGGDPNQLRSGSVLRVPATPELQAVEAREAAELVRTYARQWRQARAQPQVLPATPASTASIAAAPAAAGRLEIVPPGAGSKARGGTQSGIQAGGEGDMLRQELATTRESLAARDAEVQELRSRVAELEKLQADQQKLIAMQNSQMHAAQQRQATPPAQAAAARAAVQPHGSPLPWVGGGAVVLLGLLAVAWSRRRSRREPVFRAPDEAPRASIADAFAASPVVPQPEPEPPVAVDAVPSWGRGTPARNARARTAPAAVSDSALGAMPASPAGDAPVGADMPSPGDDAIPRDTQAETANVERLELAQAYLDLGETDNARRLLGEVTESGDATARGVAEKMLRDLG